jgi:hypothetical protein
MYGIQTQRTHQISEAKFAAWCIEKIGLKNGEVIELGGTLSGGILFDECGIALGFRPYDASPRDYSLEEVAVIKDSMCKKWYSTKEYIENGEFQDLLKAY